MTIDRIKFKHKCKESKKDNQELSATEKFKQTPEYKEILRKLGKLPPEEEQPKSPEKVVEV